MEDKRINYFYKVQKCIYPAAHIGQIEWWQIHSEKYETFMVNKWLSELNSPQTAKQYASRICKFLNYLAFINVDYKEATEKHLDGFFRYIRFGGKDNVMTIDSDDSASYCTIKGYYHAIVGFYVFLSKLNKDLKLDLDKKMRSNKYGFLSNIVWNKDTIKIYVNKNISYYKPKREYIKWYTDEEVNTIFSNLKRKRDKAIFKLSLCGMRIDEILSLRISDYNALKQYVTAYRSKGKETGNTGRSVYLDPETIRLIEDYLTNERLQVEIECMNHGRNITNYLFVVINKNSNYGEPIKYTNILGIIKRAAAKGGIDPRKIRSHSGRSTSVMKDVVFHAKHPDKLSMEDIRIKYGWKCSTSINPYLDSSNPEISRDIRKMLNEVKREQEKHMSEGI